MPVALSRSVSDDDAVSTDSGPIDRAQTIVLGLFTTFLAVAFVLLLIGDQVRASTF